MLNNWQKQQALDQNHLWQQHLFQYLNQKKQNLLS
jgi:hypothetical protein